LTRSGSSRRRRRRRLLILASILAEPLLLKLRGLPLGGNLVVRCRKGHLFTTLWIPGVSVKAIRLGLWRIQRCPVGAHWTIVTPVRPWELDADEERAARERHDARLP
jgi:hypothetical protein